MFFTKFGFSTFDVSDSGNLQTFRDFQTESEFSSENRQKCIILVEK